MSLHKPLMAAATLGCAVAIAVLPAMAQQADVPANAAGDGQAEVLTRGPIHEAFAEPVSLDPSASEVVQTEPPPPIEELPPEARPDDPDAIWIGGYWQWDPGMQDFLWVSGIWRIAPDGYRWVPGYWAEVDGGFQRVSGFWTPLENESVAYLPTPPETLETGPNVPAPSEDHFWIPGCWLYQQTRYQWRPGYWAAAQPDFVWVPAHYVYTPSGCIFVDGFWDVPLVHRGLLFAPVYFPRAVYSQPNFFYSPSVFINVNLVVNHFFALPRYHSYYFGDYYGDRYAQLGYTPWLQFTRSRGWYDPLFTYASWSYGRNNGSWTERVRHNHDFFVQNANARPAHTWTQLRQQLNNPNVSIVNSNTNLLNTNVQNVALVSTVQNALDNDRGGTRLTRLGEDQRRELRSRSQQIQELAQSRRQSEAQQGAARQQVEPGERRFKLPAVADRGADGRVRDGALPDGRADGRNAGRAPDRNDRAAGQAGVDDTNRRPDRRDPSDTQPGLTQPRTGQSPARQPGITSPDRRDADRPGRGTADLDRPGAQRPEGQPGAQKPGAQRPGALPPAEAPGAGQQGPVIPNLDRGTPDRSPLDRVPDARNRQPGQQAPARQPGLDRLPGQPGQPGTDRDLGPDRLPGTFGGRQPAANPSGPQQSGRDAERGPGGAPGLDRSSNPLPGQRGGLDRTPASDRSKFDGPTQREAFRPQINPDRARQPGANAPNRDPRSANPALNPQLPGGVGRGGLDRNPVDRARPGLSPDRQPGASRPQVDPRRDNAGRSPGPAADPRRGPQAGPTAQPRNQPAPQAQPRPNPQPGPAAQPRPDRGPQPQPGPQPGRQGKAEAPARGAPGPAANPGRGAGGQGGRKESKPNKKEDKK
jgi:hypothetical protein